MGWFPWILVGTCTAWACRDIPWPHPNPDAGKPDGGSADASVEGGDGAPTGGECEPGTPDCQCGWGTPHVLSDEEPGTYTQLAVTESGHAVALWQDGTPPEDLMVSVLEPASERWQPARAIVPDHGPNAAIDFTLLSDRDGQFWLGALWSASVWKRFDSRSGNWSELAPLPFAGSLQLRGERQPLLFEYPQVGFYDVQQNVWSTAGTEPDASRPFYEPPSFSVDDDGNIIAAWVDVRLERDWRGFPIPIPIGASARFFDRAANAWLPVQKLTDLTQSQWIRTAFDGDSQAHVLVGETLYRFDAPSRQWSPAVSRPGTGYTQLFARDSQGDIQWVAEACDGTECQLVGTRFDNEADAWQAPARLARTGADRQELHIQSAETTQSGLAFVLWSSLNDADAGGPARSAWAIRLNGSGGWSAPELVRTFDSADSPGIDRIVLNTSLADNGN
ncbi:MAG TPA: hypothetical protein VK524_26840, partial [Polyangiaceae bacterium]|nr:hypothetical protein [Polyangiaceae bacterium]